MANGFNAAVHCMGMYTDTGTNVRYVIDEPSEVSFQAASFFCGYTDTS